jgi:hypothetical protein
MTLHLQAMKGTNMLKLNNGYLLHKIAGIPFLLPYGQKIVDNKHSIRLNDSGLLLYRTLTQGADEDMLLQVLISHYQAQATDIPALKEDVKHFLLQLEGAGILSRPQNFPADNADFFFQIGPAVMAYCGPKELLMPSLFDFSCENASADLTVSIIPCGTDETDNGELLIRTNEMVICKTNSCYRFLYPADYGITEMHVSLNGGNAALFCPKPYGSGLPEKVFHALRFAYLICAQRLGAFALHSASILYREKAWLFSGSSGAGKSTHTLLWNRRYQTPFLNGDLNLLGFEGDTPVVYGIPWCGTSGYYTTSTVPLGGITFLKQAPTDTLLPISDEDIALRTMQRLISPSWTAEMMLMNLSFAEDLRKRIPVFHLQCTKEDSAATLIKQAIDENADKNF